MEKCCETCSDSSIKFKDEPFEHTQCDSDLGLICYHGQNSNKEKFKYWNPIIRLNDFITENEMKI